MANIYDSLAQAELDQQLNRLSILPEPEVNTDKIALLSTKKDEKLATLGGKAATLKDVHRRGMEQTFDALSLLNTQDVDLISRTMRPDGTGNIFGKDIPLDLEVERATDDEYGHFGRPISDVRGIDGKSVYDTFNTPEEDTAYYSKYKDKPIQGEFKPALLKSITDMDSMQFEGVTGGKGRGNDLTGVPTEDRIGGVDAYEVEHQDKQSLDYFNTPQGQSKLERQMRHLDGGATTTGENINPFTGKAWTDSDDDGMIGESIDIAQSSLTQQWGKVNKAVVDGSRWLGEQLGVSKETMEKVMPNKSGIFNKDFDELASQEVADKMNGVMAKTRAEQQKGMESALENIEKGDYFEAGFDVFKIFPYMLGDSAGEMAAIALGTPGISLAVAARVNEDAEEYEKNNDKKPDAEWMLGSVATNAAALFGERFIVKSGISSMITKGLSKAKRTGGVAVSGVGEAVQEYFDQTQQTYMTQKEGEKTLEEIATSPEAQLGALAGGVMGTTLRGAGETTGAVKDVILGDNSPVDKIKAEMARRKEAKAKAKPAADTETADAAPTMADIAKVDEEVGSGTLGSTLNSVIELEGRIEDYVDSDDLDPRVKKEYDKRKTTLVDAFNDMGEEGIKFGSTEDAENFLTIVLENTEADGNTAIKIDRVAEANNISEKSVAKIKNLITVEQEAVVGKRGTESYLRQAKQFMKDPEKNAKKIEKLDTRMRTFHEREVEYKEAIDGIVNELETRLTTAEVEASNNQSYTNKGKVERTLETDTGRVKEQKLSFDTSTLDKLESSLRNARKIADAKDRNIEMLYDAISTIGKEATKAGVDVKGYEGEGIIVPVSEEHQGERDKDQKFFDEQGVTKAIIDKAHEKHWDEYAKVESNKDVINTGKYTEDDVVVIHSTMKGKKLHKDTKDQIIAAKKAGATIVLDKSIKGNANKAIRTSIVIGDTYAVTTKNGKVYKPKKEATEEYKASEKKAVEKLKKEVAKRKAADKLVLAVAGLVSTVEELSDLGALKKKAHKSKEFEEAFADNKEYFKATDKAGQVDNMLKSAVGKIEKQVKSLGDSYKEEMAKNNFKLTDTDKTEAEMKWLKGKKFSKVSDDISELAEAKATDDIKHVSNSLNVLKQWKGMLDFVSGNEDVTTKKAIEALLADAKFKDIAQPKEVIDKLMTETSIGLQKFRNSINNASTKGMELTLKLEEIISVKDMPTVFNTLAIENMGPELYNLFDSYISEFKAPRLDLDQKDVDKKKQLKTNKPTMFDNSLLDDPARMLLIEEVNGEKQLNKNVVAAMATALIEQVAVNGRMISDKYKTKEDVARMHGVEAYTLGAQEAIELGKEGMLKKTLADDMGKAVAKHLGIKQNMKTDVEGEQYNRLVAGLGQYAILLGMDVGTFELEEMSRVEYLRLLGKENLLDSEMGDITGTKVDFIKIPGETYDDNIDMYKMEFESLDEQLPEVSTIRSGPTNHKVDPKVIDKRKSTISKDISGFKPGKKAQKTVENLMNQGWKVNFDMVDKVMNQKDDVMKLLGWKDIEDENVLVDLTYEQREVQEAKNKDIEKSIEELELLKKKYDKEPDVELFFEWFYTKNGRYMMDSNTINPQTDKQLHRFIVTPKEHEINYSVDIVDGVPQFDVISWDKGDKPKDIEQKEIQQNMYYALAQSFGKATDKDKSSSFYGEMEALLKNVAAGKLELEYVLDGETVNKTGKDATIEKAREAFMKTGEIYLGTTDSKVKIEMEHFAHALQGFDVLAQVENGNKKITSSITAEFDAVTSGFAIKLAQMPIIGRTFRYALKVGIVPKALVSMTEAELEQVFKDKGGESWAKFKADHPKLLEYLNDKKSTISMNDVLDGNINDSYQTAAEQMVGIDDKLLNKTLNDEDEQKNINDFDEYEGVIRDAQSEGLWTNVNKMVPEHVVGEKVDKKLRALFKSPFMIFNYSASIKSIRAALSRDLSTEIIEKILANENTVEIGSLYTSITDTLGNSKLRIKNGEVINSLEELQEAIRTVPADQIMLGNTKKNLQGLLETMINATYGSKLETVLSTEFKEFIEVQQHINNGFKAMFEVFNVEYKRALEEKRVAEGGILTMRGKLEVLQEMHKVFPAIKGPFTEEDMEALIPIYKTKTATPEGSVATQTWLDEKWSEDVYGKTQKTMKVWHKIKEFESAVSAGSVVPIHFIDGALMGETINHMAKEFGDGSPMTTAIHDAVMPPLLLVNKATEKYNEEYLEKSKSYNLINEIVEAVERVQSNMTKGDKGYTVKKNYNVDGKWGEHSVEDFIEGTLAGLKRQRTIVNKGRAEFQSILGEKGAYVMHMAGMAEGVYDYKGFTQEERAKMELEKQGMTKEAAAAMVNEMNENNEACY